MKSRVSKEEVRIMTVTNDTILNYAISTQSTILGLGFTGFSEKSENKEKYNE